MRRNPRLFRLNAGVALTALLWNAAVPPAALAQSAPPPLPQPYQAQPSQSQAGPPARVGRVARITGTVSFRNEGDTQWSPASVNYPVSTGNAFWTEPSTTTELEISDSRIVLAVTTEFDIATLDNAGLQAVAAQGEVYIHLRDPAAGEAWSVQTPRGLVRLRAAGRYDIVVGTTEQPTLVTVDDGAAEIEGPGVSLQVASAQTATITGTDSFEGSVGPALNDPFLTASLNAERPRPAPAAPIPAPVAAMPGGSDLAGYGSWSQAPEYGQIWYPPVSPGWVPYREGHWAYVAPWGWTWIDDAPWGFAPFHYGRWIEIGGRWAWIPGGYAVAQPPVYAPALVTFIGIGAGVALGVALASHRICWVPLGPREPYHPWYRASARYQREINVNHVTNINNNVTINNFVNRRAATAIPGAAMVASRPVQAVAEPVTPQQFAAARPIVGQQPIRPTIATAGVTPAVARQFNLGPAGIRTAPGPAVSPRAPGPTGVGFARPTLGPPGRPAPGNPAFGAVGGNPPLAPIPPGGGPAGVPTPQAARPVPVPPAPNRPGEPAFTRPGKVAPVVTPANPRAESQPVPQVIKPSPPVPPHVAAPAATPHAEPPHIAPPAAVPRVEAPHFAPPAPPPQRFTPPAAVPRAETPHFAPPAPAPQHFAPPAAAPRVEAPHFAPPAARPEPPARQKRPGEP